MWPWEHAHRVLHQWRTWTRSVADDVTSVGAARARAASRGRGAGAARPRLVVVDVAIIGEPGDRRGSARAAPARARDRHGRARRRARSCSPARLPAEGTRAIGEHLLLRELRRRRSTRSSRPAGPGSGSELVAAELRHLGGEEFAVVGTRRRRPTRTRPSACGSASSSSCAGSLPGRPERNKPERGGVSFLRHGARRRAKRSCAGVALPLSARDHDREHRGRDRRASRFLAWVLPLPDVPDDLQRAAHERDRARREPRRRGPGRLPLELPAAAAGDCAGCARVARRTAPSRRARCARRCGCSSSRPRSGASPRAGFLALNLQYSTRLAVSVGITVLLGGAVTCSLGYLLAERILRPVTELALADERAGAAGRPRRHRARAAGLGARHRGARCSASCSRAAPRCWGSATSPATGSPRRWSSSARSRLTVGLAAMLLAARSVADPVERVRHAVARGRSEGDVDVQRCRV